MNDQPNYIIFKLYRNSHFSDKYLHSITNEYEKTIIDLASATKKHNRKLIFTSRYGDNNANFFVNTPYLEVLYNGDELSQEERDLYIGFVKKLFSDGVCFFGRLESYIPELVVRFSKLPSDDTFEVMPETGLDSPPKRPNNTHTSLASPVKY